MSHYIQFISLFFKLVIHYLYLGFLCFTISTIHAQDPPDISGEWELRNIEEGTSGFVVIDQEGVDIKLTFDQGRNTNLYQGTIINDQLILESPVSGRLRTSDARRCHQEVVNNPTEYPNYKNKMSLSLEENLIQGQWVLPSVECSDGNAKGIVLSTKDIMLVRLGITPMDQFDEEIALSANFSHPYPVVILDDFQVKGIQGNKAIVEVAGTVTCAIADIVEREVADIKEVTVEFLATDMDNDNPVKINIPVTKNEGSATPLKPFPFSGTFSKEIEVPIWPGQVFVSVEASNIIKNLGYDSFVINVDDYKFIENQNNETLNFKLATFESNYRPQITHYDHTDEGLVSPIVFQITDPSINAESFGEINLKLEDNDIELKLGKAGKVIADRPVMGVAGEIPSEISNLFNINNLGEIDIKYKNKKEKLSFNYTAHSPPNYYKYAAGTTVKHRIVDNVAFSEWDVIAAEAQYKGGLGWRKDTYITAKQNMVLEQLGGRKHALTIELTLDRRADVFPKKRILLTLKKGKRELKVGMGAFEVTKLKTMMITVDGFAYSSAVGILDDGNSANAPTFKRIFNNAFNQYSPALSALPTITWTNWTGIFSTMPPKDHGVTGNSFFERERGTAKPTNSASSNYDKLDGLKVASGYLNRFAKTSSGSLYDDLDTYGIWKSVSVHQWYSRAANASVSNHYFPKSPVYTFHSEYGAKVLDRRSAKVASNVFKARPQIHAMAIYFPGPDNIAHAVGNKTGQDKHKDGKPQGFFSLGPALPDVSTPLSAIREQFIKETDKQFKRVVDEIEKRGYLNATLFAVVADHGLHAYHNTPSFNLTLNGGMENIFKALSWKVWRGGNGDANLVYAPNGGMAQIYLRNKFWSIAPKTSDIEQLARVLFIESTGGKATHPDTGVTANLSTLKSYPSLNPKPNPALNYGMDYGAYGSPPAIFVRTNPEGSNFMADYRWVKFAPTDFSNGIIEYGTIDAFIYERQTNGKYPNFDWPEFEERIKEFNDKNLNGSRSGDIIVFTDGRHGYMSILDGDELNGWHGGATVSESYVPLMFNIAGDVVIDKTFILDALNTVKAGNGPNKKLRNWQLAAILKEIYKTLYAED